MVDSANHSQASSHFPLDPVSGAVLFEQEARRRDLHNSCSRLLMTGCRELDVEVLCGGFERGCVVGISAEESQGGEGGGVGLVLALQTLARRCVVRAAARQDVPTRAMVITTLSMGALLPLLRDVFRAQLAAAAAAVGGGGADKAGLLKRLLEGVQIARVFDIPGLWEVLGDLDRWVEEEEEEDQRHDQEDAVVRPEKLPSSSPLSDPPSSLPDEPPWETTNEAGATSRTTPPGHRDEIQDSEDEDEQGSSPLSRPGDASGLSSAGQPAPEHHHVPPSSSKTPPEDLPRQAPATPAVGSTPPIPTAALDSTEDRPQQDGLTSTSSSRCPEIIIITHMSHLLSTLFQQREKSTAHQTLQLLSSHIRYLTRAPEYGGPLVMLLNSTTSSDNSSNNPPGGAPNRPDRPPPPPPAAGDPSALAAAAPKNKTLDPSLRSIFNPPPLVAAAASGPSYYAYDTPPRSRQNKPSFGLVFTQLLDMHLLCTQVPKAKRDDAEEALYAAPAAATGVIPPTKKAVTIAHGWVVEALLDEIGVWEGRAAVVEGGRRRRSREQRWGAVEVRRDREGGVALADLFG